MPLQPGATLGPYREPGPSSPPAAPSDVRRPEATVFRRLAFVVLLVAAAPAIAIGYIVLVVEGVFLARRSGVSGTAMNPLFTRWLLERAGDGARQCGCV